MKKTFIAVLILTILTFSKLDTLAQQIEKDKLYLGQIPPKDTPVIFAPGIVSLENRLETYPAFSPDGNEIYFSVVNASWTAGAIFYSKYQDNKWTDPDTASFSKNKNINWESSISPDGKKQFFTSNRPPSQNMDIWMSERTFDLKWSNPVRLNSPVNSASVDGSACIVSNQDLYFTSRRGGGSNGSILYRAKLINNEYSQIENLGSVIKTEEKESEPYMSPDENYLIFISEKRQNGYGGWDLWICFRNLDNSWSVPINMGPEINTDKDEYGPRVSPDGKYLFFTRETRGKNMDIYWVSSSIINKLKSENSIR